MVHMMRLVVSQGGRQMRVWDWRRSSVQPGGDGVNFHGDKLRVKPDMDVFELEISTVNPGG